MKLITLAGVCAVLLGLQSPTYADLTAASESPMQFATYTNIFVFIADFEQLPDDPDTLFTLAVDSTIDRTMIDGIGQVLIITANYYGTSKYNSIRGAQLNGRFFVVRVRDEMFELVGVLRGNGYRWDNVGKTRRLVTSWHLSAAESPKTTYTWNGTVFEPFSLSLK